MNLTVVVFCESFPEGGDTDDWGGCVKPLICRSEVHELSVEHVSVTVSFSFTAAGFSKVIGHGFSKNMKMRQYQQKCKGKWQIITSNSLCLCLHIY